MRIIYPESRHPVLTLVLLSLAVVAATALVGASLAASPVSPTTPRPGVVSAAATPASK